MSEYDSVHASDIGIVINGDPITFANKLNAIVNFILFFDKWEPFGAKDGEEYEITYHNDGQLSIDAIEKLISDIVALCETENFIFSGKFKVYDDGEFLMYIIVKENEIHHVHEDVMDAIYLIETDWV